MMNGVFSRQRGKFSTSLLACTALWALGGCSTLAPKPGADAQAIASAQSLAEQAAAQALTDFESQQQGLAAEAERQGHWAQAAWHWESLLALRPGDTGIQERQQRAVQAAESLATLRVSQARLALQLGDTESARELLLRALAAQPTLTEAAQGLREIETVRVQQQAAKVVSRHRPARRARLPAVFEHAQLLALQGDVDGAIALLRPLAEARPPDRAARRRLADYLLILGQQQYASDPAAAMRTVRSSLQLDPSLRAARQTLREWQRTAGSTGRRAAP